MTTVAVPAPRVTSWPSLQGRGLAVTRTQVKVVAMAVTTALALGFRTAALSTYGLSEDEVHKIQAIERYRAGDFTANAEHPMLMKLAIWGSVELANRWNAIAPSGQTVPIETAVRLPNAIAGTLTAAVVFAVGDVLFGTAVAVAGSLLWALDINAIAIGRIGKEDTFLLFFFLVAVWCYERAKRQGATDAAGAQRWYTTSGASFGLMFASKYFPHLLGVYSLFNTITDRDPGANRPNRRRFWGAMTVTFLLTNVAILLPETWHYCARYVQGGTLTHHGYLYGDRLYVTNIPLSTLGVPVTYYLRFIATKVPIAVLVMAAIGWFQVARHSTERGFVLVRVLLVFLLVPYSLMAAKFLRYTLPLLVVIDLTAAVGLVTVLRHVFRLRGLSIPERRILGAAILSLSIGTVAMGTASAAPFYSLYQNALGGHLAAPGTTFHEETYDYGVREAVSAIARAAAPSAAIVSDAPAVVAAYVKAAGRDDIHVRSLSGQGIPYDSVESWVIVQDEHTTFENQTFIEQLRRRERPWREFRAADVLAAQVFRLEKRELRHVS